VYTELQYNIAVGVRSLITYLEAKSSCLMDVMYYDVEDDDCVSNFLKLQALTCLQISIFNKVRIESCIKYCCENLEYDLSVDWETNVNSFIEELLAKSVKVLHVVDEFGCEMLLFLPLTIAKQMLFLHAARKKVCIGTVKTRLLFFNPTTFCELNIQTDVQKIFRKTKITFVKIVKELDFRFAYSRKFLKYNFKLHCQETVARQFKNGKFPNIFLCLLDSLFHEYFGIVLTLQKKSKKFCIKMDSCTSIADFNELLT
jgi:hypothetical protein